MKVKIFKREIIPVNYEKNLKKLLGWENSDMRILRKSAGALRGILKKDGVSYQREMRKEWEDK